MKAANNRMELITMNKMMFSKKVTKMQLARTAMAAIQAVGLVCFLAQALPANAAVPGDGSSAMSQTSNVIAMAPAGSMQHLMPFAPGVIKPTTVAPSKAPLTQSTEAFDFNPYLKDMGHRFSSGWTGERPASSCQATVAFTLHANGKVTDLKISKSSGIKSVDDTAIDTVMKTALPAMPAGAPDEVDVTFTFHLNVY